MRNILVIWLMLISSTFACNFAAEEQAAAPTSIATARSTFTPTPAATSTPTPTASPTPTTAQNSSASQNSQSSACTPRTDWPTYQVVSGDTLSSLATRVSSTVSELMTGNCLTDANQIRVGQTLRVPRTPTTAAAAAPTGGAIQITPALHVSHEHYQLTPGTTITITWQNPPTGLLAAEFSLSPVDNLNQLTSLGMDNNLSDGAAITWTVPAQIASSRLYAGGRFPGQTHQIANAPYITVFTVMNPSLPTPVPTSVGFLEASVTANQANVVLLDAGQPFSVYWYCPPEHTERVEFVLITAAGERLTLGTTTDLQYYTRCFRNYAILNTTVPDVATTGQMQAISYQGSTLTGYSAFLNVEIRRPS